MAEDAAAAVAALVANVPSEMPRHCEAKPREMADFEDDAWVHCEPDENLES